MSQSRYSLSSAGLQLCASYRTHLPLAQRGTWCVRLSSCSFSVHSTHDEEKQLVRLPVSLQSNKTPAGISTRGQTPPDVMDSNPDVKKRSGASEGGVSTCDSDREDYHSEDLQKICEACTEVPDSSHWVLVEPDVSTGKDDSTYSLSSPAGRYECSESGLRWSCAGQVTLQYCFIDWHLLAGDLQYRPAGSSMDIKLISGELEEIHLPHFLCLGGSQSCLKDAVKVLHKQDGGVCLEKCELSRFHARLVNPTSSLLGLFYSLISPLLPGKKQMKIHADVQVYLSSTVPFTFRTYLLPADAYLRMLLKEQEMEEGFGGTMLAKGRPENPLQMKEFYVLKADCDASICPGELSLRYSDIVPNFTEVHLTEALEFKMEFLRSSDQQQVWEVKIWKNECFWNKTTIGW